MKASCINSGGTEVFGSFPSNGTMGAGDSQCPIEEEREAAREAARLFRLEGCTKADVAERLNDRYRWLCLDSDALEDMFCPGFLSPNDVDIGDVEFKVRILGDGHDKVPGDVRVHQSADRCSVARVLVEVRSSAVQSN